MVPHPRLPLEGGRTFKRWGLESGLQISVAMLAGNSGSRVQSLLLSQPGGGQFCFVSYYFLLRGLKAQVCLITDRNLQYDESRPFLPHSGIIAPICYSNKRLTSIVRGRWVDGADTFVLSAFLLGKLCCSNQVRPTQAQTSNI